MTRLTIDLDSPSARSASAKFRLARVLWPSNEARLYVSASGRGFHLEVFGLPYGFEEIIHWRRWFGDDRLRIFHDRIRHGKGVCHSVLFTEKSGGRKARRVV